jgi:hypothetical protein
MKRLIRFHNRVSSMNDKPEFSHSGTVFEVLPILVKDNAGPATLKALAKQLGFRTRGAVQTTPKPASYGGGRHSSILTHSLKLTTKVAGNGMYSKETYCEWIGFVTLPESDILTPSAKPAKLTKAQARAIVEDRAFGIEFTADRVDGQYILVKSGWNFYTDLRLYGFHHEQLLKAIKAEDYGFYDDIDTCSECGKAESRDNGYTSNFRYIESEGNLGIRCGCYQEYAESAESLDDYAGNADKAMELDAAKKHADAGRLKFIERFIGGMTDPGHGGYWAGGETENDYDKEGSVRDGNPKKILAALKKANPKGVYMFSHDESGQFQTYFSVWEVIKGPVSEDRLNRARESLAQANLESSAS